MWLLLQWHPPEEPRGVIRGYILSFKRKCRFGLLQTLLVLIIDENVKLE